MAVYSDVVAISALQWRDQLNDLNKRMGDLRDNPGAVGAWVRLYGSEQELGNITGKSASVQVAPIIRSAIGRLAAPSPTPTDHPITTSVMRTTNSTRLPFTGRGSLTTACSSI